MASNSSLTQSSFESYKKQKEDQKKKQAGEIAPDVDIESGKIINPHNPEFITKVPWYLGNNNGPTLTHHNVQKQDHYLSLNETEQLIELKNQQRQLNNVQKSSQKGQIYQKGACKNCGSLTHTEKECIERPRSQKKAAWKTGIATTTATDDVILKLEDHGKVSYDAKRDYWKGYDPKQYNEVIENFQIVEDERRRVKLEEKEERRKLKEQQLKEKEQAKKMKDKSRLKKKSDGDNDDDDGDDSDGNNDKTTESSSDSDSDSDSDVDSDNEDDDEDNQDGVDIKTDFINRDEKAVDFQYQFGRQGGVGGNEFKLTSRNLRIREDTPKYLRNLALNSAFYDPKSRSMRANPYPDANPEDLPYAGDNFLRQSGDALKLASTQVLCWEMQGNQGTTEDGQVIDVISNPSQAELLQKQFIEKKKQLNDSKKRAILEKYGSNDKTGDGDQQGKEMDVRLRLGQTEAYVEYSRDGRVIKGVGTGPVKTSKLTKYDEDVYINNHTSVWGSYYHRGQRAWGFACCHSLVKNSYCVGKKGIETNDAASSNAATGNVDQQQARRMLESITNNPNKSSSKSVTKRSDIYGESSLDATIQLDKTKVQQALESFKQQSKKGDGKEEVGEDVVGVGKKRGGYNSMKGVDVSIEDMEAYRMSKFRRDDPMEKFMNQDEE